MWKFNKYVRSRSLHFIFISAIFLIWNSNYSNLAFGEKNGQNLWSVQISDVKVSKLKKKTREIHYKLTEPEENSVSEQNPVWVFVKYSLDGGKVWQNTDDTEFKNDLDPGNSKSSVVNKNLTGDVGLIDSVGDKSIVWNCGKDGTGYDGKEVLVRVRAIEMCRVPADKSFQMGGRGSQTLKTGFANINQFYLATYPATYDLFSQFLNECANSHDIIADSNHKFWCKEMAKDEDGGLIMQGALGSDAVWTPKNGRERWPVGHITYWVAHDFALWAGLEIPTEPETEKAARNIGGVDGVKYSWGNLPKPNRAICNFGNNIEHPTDVRAYDVSWLKNGLSNPFGLREMTGNVWEWQDTYWYDGGGAYDATQNYTVYNCDTVIKERYKELDTLKADGKIKEDEWMAERKKISLKGWRVIKGGSYFDAAYALDASSRIVGDTKVRHSAVGCRFAKR